MQQIQNGLLFREMNARSKISCSYDYGSKSVVNKIILPMRVSVLLEKKGTIGSENDSILKRLLVILNS